MSIYTVEAQAHDGTVVQTVYAASDTYNTEPNDLPANQHFRVSLKTPANIERQLFSGSTTGTATIGFGEIVINNADGRCDPWAEWSFDGRPCIVKAIVIDPDTQKPIWLYKDAPVLIRGTVESVDVSDAFTVLKLRFYDRMLDLDKPLLTTRYAGAVAGAGGGASGTADLKDTLIPRLYGSRLNIVPVDVNPFDLIRQVSDKACSAITAYDGGLALTNDGDSADVTALVGATIAAGHYRTCLALGLFRLGGSPVYAITADATAATAGDAAGIARQVLLDLGLSASELDAASFTALAAKNNATCGLWIADDRTAVAAASEALRAIGGWIIADGQGVFSVGRLELPSGTPLAAFKEWMCAGPAERMVPNDGQGGTPAYRVVLRYGQLGRTQGTTDLAGAVTPARRAALALEWRSAVAEDVSVKTRYLLAQELTFDTCLQDASAAAAEAARRLAIYKVRRDVWRVRVPMSDVDFRYDKTIGSALAQAINLGAVVQLGLSRFLNPPASLVVIGRVEDCVANQIKFDLWK